MRTNGWKLIVAVAALAMIVTPAFAKPVMKIITISAHQKIAGKELKNDDYTFIVDDTKMVVELRHKVVAEVTGHWEPRDRKYERDTVVSAGDGQIMELRFAGEKRAFIVSAI